MKRRPPEEVEPRKHGVVTKIGSVVFDEKEERITVTFGKGNGQSTIVMSDDGIELEGPKVKIKGDRVEIKGDEVCVNDQGVVLEKFFSEVFLTHMHGAAPGNPLTSPPTFPVPTIPSAPVPNPPPNVDVPAISDPPGVVITTDC
jgi:hypothetical protein